MKEFWKTIGKDIVIALLVLAVFGYYQYLMPKNIKQVDEVHAASTEAQNVIDLSQQKLVLNPMKSSSLKYETEDENATITNLEKYQAEDEQVSYETYRIDTTINEKKETIFVTDMYMTDVQFLQAGLAQGQFGKQVLEEPCDILRRYDGLTGISGDSFGEADGGIIVRNGVWYQVDINTNDLCILYLDGTMETVHATDFDESAVREKGAWQIWSFGPALMENGVVGDTFQTTDYVAANNPRSAIGYVEPGHYIFIVVDGRQDGYSEGLDIQELADLCSKLGCTSAYNLDGGRTAAMMNQENLINIPSDGMAKVGGRDMSDIIYIGKTIQ